MTNTAGAATATPNAAAAVADQDARIRLSDLQERAGRLWAGLYFLHETFADRANGGSGYEGHLNEPRWGGVDAAAARAIASLAEQAAALASELDPAAVLERGGAS